MGAIEDFNKYIELAPSMFAYLTRAKTKESMGDTEGAMLDYNLMVEQAPDIEFVYKQRAKFRRKFGDIEGAKADELKAKVVRKEERIKEIQNLNKELSELEETYPDSNVYSKVSILESIISMQMEIEDYTGAIVTLNKAIGVKPSDSLFELRAKAKKALGDMEGYQADMTESRWVDRREKLQLLNQTLEANPQDVNALVERAKIWMYVREYPKALADTNKAIEIEPSLIEALKVRSRAKKKLRDLEGARADRHLIWQIQNQQN